MTYELIRNSQAAHPDSQACRLEVLADCTIESSCKGAVLHRDNGFVVSGYEIQHLPIQRLEETEVVHTHGPGMQRSGLLCPTDAWPKGHNGNAGATPEFKRLPDREERSWRCPPLGALPLPARVPYYKWSAVMMKGSVHQVAKLSLVGRSAYYAVGDHAVGRKIEGSMVRGTILSHQAGSVEAEHYRKPLKRHVMDNLVIGSLREG